MGIAHRILKQASSNEAGWVGHVYHEECSHLVGNTAHTGIIPITAVGRPATNYEFRLALSCKALHLIIINTAGRFVQGIPNGVIEYAGCVDG